MPDLNFQVQGIEPEKNAISPVLNFRLRIEQADKIVPIHAIALLIQIRLEPARRKYDGGEEKRLFELFGRRDQWSHSLRGMLWTHATAMIPAFTSSTLADLPIPCTFDFNVAMTRYFDALEEGDIPLSLLFSGTIFHENREGQLQVAPISWEKEASARLPLRTWREMMQQYYPHCAWLCLNKETFDKLNQYRTASQMASFEQAIENLLAHHTREPSR